MERNCIYGEKTTYIDNCAGSDTAIVGADNHHKRSCGRCYYRRRTDRCVSCAEEYNLFKDTQTFEHRIVRGSFNPFPNGKKYSGDKKLHQKMAAEVFEAFKKQEGTVKCGDIYGKYHFYHCDGCNLCAVQKVIEVLYNNGDIQTATVQPWNNFFHVSIVEKR